MKDIFFTCALLALLLGGAYGQNTIQVRPYINPDGFTLQSNWQIQNGQLMLTTMSIETPEISINLSSEDGDVIVEHTLPEPKKNHSFDFELKVKMDSEEIFILPLKNYILKKDEVVGKSIKTTSIWTDVLDRFLINENDVLAINLLVKDIISLPPPPEFGMKQKLPFFGGMALGTGMAIAGIVIKQDADNIYEDKYLTQFFSDPAEPFYNEANDKRKRSQVLLYTGGAVAATSVILYFSKRQRVKRQQETYNNFLLLNQPVLSFSPTIIYQNDGSMASGFNLVYNF